MTAPPPDQSPCLIVSDVECLRGGCGAEGQSTACAYRVAWSINPHMRIGAAQPARALWQHCAFVRLLEELGARVTRVPFVHAAHDSVFAKDNAILVHRRDRTHVLLAHPAHAVRHAEQEPRARAFRALSFDVMDAPSEILEGGDVVMLPGARGAFLGHGHRSTARAAEALERFLDAPVTPLELVDPRLYHLDMAVTVLSDGTALVCEEALSRESLTTLLRMRELTRVVPVPLEEALRFGVNCVEVGRDLVLGGSAPKTEAALRALGWRTHRPSLGQFHLAGGSAACLVSRIHVPDGRSALPKIDLQSA